MKKVEKILAITILLAVVSMIAAFAISRPILAVFFCSTNIERVRGSILFKEDKED